MAGLVGQTGFFPGDRRLRELDLLGDGLPLFHRPIASGKSLTAWRHASIEVLLSDYILDELRRVLHRLAYRHGLNGGRDGRSGRQIFWPSKQN
ncbi:hypothetical protein [Acidithiobacillus thiooxidans]|uniref:hypothetical protein n=1 Tax=Acidithiobacillus thiooxidans TaxID=930 RepID=UPI00242F951E|nr:hypothetical protein [Acidithiobacillus thiooxidans]